MGSNLLPAQQGRLARPDVPRLSGAHFALKFRLCDEIYENSTAFSAARVLMAFGWALLLNNAHGAMRTLRLHKAVSALILAICTEVQTRTYFRPQG